MTAQRSWSTPTLVNRLPQSKTRDRGRGTAEGWAMDQAVTPSCRNEDNTSKWQAKFSRGDPQTRRDTNLVQSSLLVCFTLELYFLITGRWSWEKGCVQRLTEHSESEALVVWHEQWGHSSSIFLKKNIALTERERISKYY